MSYGDSQSGGMFLRTTQNGDFVLLPFGVLRLVGAVALSLRSDAPSALLLPSFVLVLCLARAHSCGCSS